MPAAPFTRPRSILKNVLSLSVRVLLFMLLVVAGDVERNPGPLSIEGTSLLIHILTLFSCVKSIAH